MDGYKSRIGKSQMRQYMGELYEDCMVVYREYIQNACDSIEDAVAAGLITDRKKTTIIVNIDTYNHTISIEDKGIGIPSDKIGPYLVDVASSKKINRAGQYGIGRLNGANYCDEIRYETSAAGEGIKSILTWDVKKAREICQDPEQDPTTEEIIDLVTTLHPSEPENIDEHYCRVTLVNVNNEELMDQEKVIAYIQQIVPLDYSLEFKDNLLKPSLDLDCNVAYAERFKNLWIYKISVNNTPVEKKYSSVESGFEFGSLKCFTLIDPKTEEEFAWGWYAMNKTVKQMNDIPTSFIRARHCNYQIGPSTLLAGLYPYPIAPAYFIGELHLTHPDLQPTASRDGIKQNATKSIFELRIKRFFKELYTLYNKTSKFRSEVVDKLIDADIQIYNLTQKLKSEDDPAEKAKIKEKIKEEKTTKETARKKIASYSEYFTHTDSWFAAGDVIDAVNDSTVKSHNSKTEVIKGDSQIRPFNVNDFKIEEKAPEKPNPISPSDGPGDAPSNPDSGRAPLPEDPTPVDTMPEDNELDIYKGLSQVERKLIKKFYNVINNSSDIPTKIKDKIKKNLSKKILK